ncbi:MAG: uracil-DNA glycosylase [Victivallales bacterium]
MSKQGLLNQIIECLEIEAEQHEYAELAPAVLRDFMKLGVNEAAKTANTVERRAPAPSRPVAVQAYVTAAEARPSKTMEPTDKESESAPLQKLNVEDMPYEVLEKKAAACTRCRLHKSRTNPVFGDGSIKAELMFIGEGPGRDEDEQGIPFVGKAGQLLDKMIEAMQFTRKEVYIANIVKCRPPDNRAPMDDEAEQCLPYLLRQIEIIQPKAIVLLGAVPLKYILGQAGVTKIRGNWKEFRGIKVMPTLHPAYLLRNPAAKKDAWDDLQQVMAFFGKKHKGSSKT